MNLFIFNKNFPSTSGVYFFKNKDNIILYIGKAKNLERRILSYNTDRQVDWKIKYLLKKTYAIDYIETKSEKEALLLEADLISRHKPLCNKLLTSETPFYYIIFKEDKEKIKEIIVSRYCYQKKYFILGPFLRRYEAYTLWQHITDLFNLKKCNKKVKNGCLHFHLGLCSGSCLENFDNTDYEKRYFLAIQAIKKEKKFIKTIENKIKISEKKFDIENIEKLYNYKENYETILSYLKKIGENDDNSIEKKITFLENEEILIKEGLLELKKRAKINKNIITIDCIDISHFQGNALSGAIIRFIEGKYLQSDSKAYSLKIKRNDDYKNLLLLLKKHYNNIHSYPDLLLIDGGKGQLGTVLQYFKENNISVFSLALAKKEEKLFGLNLPEEGLLITPQTNYGKILIKLRNTTHNAAIELHKKIRMKNFFSY